MKITRRNLLAKVTVGVIGLPLMRGLSWAQAKGKLGYMKIVDNAAMFMAMEKGFFKAEGLEIETVPMAGGAVIVQGVTSGDLQFGWTNVISLYQAVAEDFDFKLIAGGATNVRGTNETHAIEVLKDSPIKGAKDLEGKTVAVNTLNNIVHLMAMAWVDKNGGTSSKIKFVEIPFPQMADALFQKRIDAVWNVEPFVTFMTQSGKAKVLAYPYIDNIPGMDISNYFAKESWIKAHPDVAARFKRAIDRATDDLAKMPKQERDDWVAKYTGMKLDVVKNVTLPVFSTQYNVPSLKANLQLAIKYKMINKPIDVETMIWKP